MFEPSYTKNRHQNGYFVRLRQIYRSLVRGDAEWQDRLQEQRIWDKTAYLKGPEFYEKAYKAREDLYAAKEGAIDRYEVALDQKATRRQKALRCNPTGEKT